MTTVKLAWVFIVYGTDDDALSSLLSSALKAVMLSKLAGSS
jgi:hypothetical protein